MIRTILIRAFFAAALVSCLLLDILPGGVAADPRSTPGDTQVTAEQVSQQMKWILIPAGEFWMGSTSEQAHHAYERAKLRSSMLDERHFEAEVPRHRVYLDAFEISKYEITNSQYRAFIEATGRPRPRGYQGEDTWADETLNGDEQPVVGVTWFDAQAFAEWVGGSLPSEAQWERTAGGPESLDYPWGDARPSPKLANFGRRYNRPTPVGQLMKGASSEGVCDLAGNVWEWCLDEYDPLYYQRSPKRNPLNLHRRDVLIDRVIRGGSWDFGVAFMRTKLRFRFYPLNSTHNIGFRVVRPASPTPSAQK